MEEVCNIVGINLRRTRMKSRLIEISKGCQISPEECRQCLTVIVQSLELCIWSGTRRFTCNVDRK